MCSGYAIVNIYSQKLFSKNLPYKVKTRKLTRQLFFLYISTWALKNYISINMYYNTLIMYKMAAVPECLRLLYLNANIFRKSCRNSRTEIILKVSSETSLYLLRKFLLVCYPLRNSPCI